MGSRRPMDMGYITRSDLNSEMFDQWRSQLDAALEALKPMPARNGSGKKKVNAKEARERIKRLDDELREAWLNALQKER